MTSWCLLLLIKVRLPVGGAVRHLDYSGFHFSLYMRCENM